mgnify:CR=1 FL=1
MGGNFGVLGLWNKFLNEIGDHNLVEDLWHLVGQRVIDIDHMDYCNPYHSKLSIEICCYKISL